MSNFSQKVTLTEKGHVLLPKTLRYNLCWNIGDIITVSLNTEDGVVTLRSEKATTKQEASGGETHGMYSVIDDWGRVTLPKEARESLGWGHADILFISQTPDPESNEASVTRIKQHELKCVLCKALEVIATINGSGVCKKCVETLAKSLPSAV